jgi:hypothetical protein
MSKKPSKPTDSAPRKFLDALYGGKPPKVDGAILDSLRLHEGLAGKDHGPLFAQLPDRHRQMLALSDGLDLLAGSYRLFGWDNETSRSMRRWNDVETWKFAWGDHPPPYLCFGESVLGNQFAYREDELSKGGAAKVYELYAVTLEPICRYHNFDHFLDGGFLNGVLDDAYHGRIAQARHQLGSFELDKHLAYAVSPLLTAGAVDVQQLMIMSASSHMIVNGDLWRQIAHRDSLAGLKGIEDYVDSKGRSRLRVQWS